MKKFFFAVITALIIGTSGASAFDPKDLLNGIAGAASGSNSDSNSSGSGLLDAVGGFVNNLTASKNFDVNDLVGTWKYKSPSVSFESDNALQNIGGAAAATALQGKIEPYYTKIGLTKTVLTVAEDHTFDFKFGAILLKGTVVKDEKQNLVFKFSAFGKISLGQLKAHATKSGNTLNITFDATKLIQLLTKVASVANISSVNAIAGLLDSYDGVYLGFQMSKSK